MITPERVELRNHLARAACERVSPVLTWIDAERIVAVFADLNALLEAAEKAILGWSMTIGSLPPYDEHGRRFADEQIELLRAAIRRAKGEQP